MMHEMDIKDIRCAVVANGAFPENEAVVKRLAGAQFIIACDGAAMKLLAHGVVPDAIVGDLDSVDEELRQSFVGEVYCNPDQEINDLTKALLFAQEKGYREVAVFGATGLREDHTLGNISLLGEHSCRFACLQMETDYGVFNAIKRNTSFSSFPGQQVSIFSLNTEVAITVSGLRFPIVNRRFTSWWQGTLNEATDTRFSIQVSGSDALVIVFRNY